MKNTLYDKLLSIKNTSEYAFHMPGHKRNETEKPFDEIMQIDITEIEGFDNLHHAEGIIKQEQQFAAKLYGAKETFFLINGSTAGILAAICASTETEDKIILARNSHKSAYHGIFLSNLETYYVHPQTEEDMFGICGKILPEDVATLMDTCGAKVVFLTSPTYEGVVSDIASIAEEVHKKDGILIVDEAHGAHFGFHSFFPKSAVTQGADIVIQSMHKTLPSLTQTALLHVCSERISHKKIAMWLGIFQTSSPSYVLMASISRCLHMLKNKKKELFESYAENLKNFYNRTKHLKNIKVITPKFIEETYGAQQDISKINICVYHLLDKEGRPYRGKELAKDLLQKYKLQMEMTSEYYVIAMTSIYDTRDGFERLEKALFEIDKTLSAEEVVFDREVTLCKEENIISGIMSVKSAFEAKKRKEAWRDCEGKISAEYIYLYPPGSPVLVPGERITKSIREKIEQYKRLGLSVQGPEDESIDSLWTIDM